eukprot:TRINITY_DN1936_c0_g1_i1.p2 TRINITY_DN1936_c0_g1~~TRINITY_DN1936_c0_g1_i1.p2  ORF type:complete len:116 (-),score=54.90 TRINITY_DN1936_c0_g1_i1:504-809(-)
MRPTSRATSNTVAKSPSPSAQPSTQLQRQQQASTPQAILPEVLSVVKPELITQDIFRLVQEAEEKEKVCELSELEKERYGHFFLSFEEFLPSFVQKKKRKN